MGGKGGKDSYEQRLALGEQAALTAQQRGQAAQVFNTAFPIQKQVAGVLGDFLGTQQTPSFLDLNPTVQPLAAASLPGLEAQRNLLQRRLMAQGIRGGQLSGQLAQADLQGALQRAELMQQDILRQEARDVDRLNIRRNLFGAAADVGTGGVGQSFQGLAGAAGSNAASLQAYAQQQALQQQRDLMASQGAGQLLGKALSLGGNSLMGKSSPGTPSYATGRGPAGGFVGIPGLR